MTTPERLRRRQRFIELILVPLVILCACGSVIYSNQQSDKQQACMADQFAKLSESLNARSNLSQRASNAVAKVLSTAANAKSGDEVAAALREYDRETRAIAKEREEHPLPKFPTGRCTNGDNNGVLPVQRFSGIDSFGAVDPPYLAGLDAPDVDGTPSAVRRPAGVVAASDERQPDPGRGSGSGGPARGDGSGGGGSGSGGGPGESAGRPPTEAVERLVGQVRDVVKKTAPVIQKTSDVVADSA